MRRKSTWIGRSLMGSTCRSRGMTRLLLALDVHLEHGGGEVALQDLLPQLVVVERDGFRRLAGAVDDGGHFSFAASLACGPLACTRARRGFELDRGLSHGIDLRTKKGPYGPKSRVRPPRVPGGVSCALLEMARVIAAGRGLGNRPRGPRRPPRAGRARPPGCCNRLTRRHFLSSYGGHSLRVEPRARKHGSQGWKAPAGA